MSPGKKIPGDYKSAIRPTAGSHLEVLQELITESKDLVDYHCFDGIKTEKNLLFNKY